MIYLVYFLFFFLFIRLLVAIINFLSFRFLKPRYALEHGPSTSILIPARNEEKNIGSLLSQLESLRSQPLEIIVYNDHSTDGTSAVVKEFMANNAHIQLIEGVEPAEGWLGKNHACDHLAQIAKGEIFLFLDADISIRDGVIQQAIGYLQKHQLDLLSIFPKQIFKTFGEKITVPLMNWILLSLLPMFLIRRSMNPAFSAANGQFMMFRASTYRRHHPHNLFRNSMVEDIVIMQFFKKKKLKVDTLLGKKGIECRMYTGAEEAIVGFTKNIFQFFGGSAMLSVLMGVITTFAPFFIFLNFTFFVGLTYILGIVLIRTFVSLASNQSVVQNVLLIIPQHLVFLIIIVKRILSERKKELIWKERNVL